MSLLSSIVIQHEAKRSARTTQAESFLGAKMMGDKIRAASGKYFKPQLPFRNFIFETRNSQRLSQLILLEEIRIPLGLLETYQILGLIT